MGKRSSVYAFVFLLCLIIAPAALAHKLAPSLLRLSEQQPNTFAVTWKTPAVTAVGKGLQPVFPQVCQMTAKPTQANEGTATIWRWPMACSEDLTGKVLAVKGMAESATATLVKIERLNGDKVQQLLTAESSTFIVPVQQTAPQVMLEYIQLGAEHIWAGIDHLLFVLALLLLVPGTRLLIWTITSFTIGHSLTLSLVILGYLDYPVSLVEVAIAASIFVLAVELVQGKKQPGGSSRWIPSHSWVVAIGFGLLHGMGFAGALKDVGLPDGDIPLALFSFNIGIELGQIAFVFAVMLLMRAGGRWLKSLAEPGWWLTVYSIGGLSAFWCIERGLSAFS